MAESSVHHSRRKSRIGKNKYKVEEASSAEVVVTPALSKETIALDTSVDNSKSKASRDVNRSLDERMSSPNEEVQGRVNNQWKSQYSRRIPRNPQANKSTENSKW
uniref:Uncharacterized protein n=1 Tax=Salix viminalis TaxID=40686 RepID=A0A6N2KD52_SALVM